MIAETILGLLKRLCLDIVDKIDNKDFNLSEEEANDFISIFKSLIDKEVRLSKYSACRYLNISRATFDNYISQGKIPKGTKEAGFKELSWSKKSLDDFVKRYKN